MRRQPVDLPLSPALFRAALVAVGLATALVLALAPRAVAPEPAFAADAAETPPAPQVTGSFDKQSYDLGERATATFTVSNDTGIDWGDVKLAASLPQGARLADGAAKASVEVDRVAAGDVVELRIPLLFDEGIFGKKLAPTGDGPGAGIVLAAVLAAAFVALAAACFSRNRARSKRSRCAMTLVVSFAMVAGLAPLLPEAAHAEESGGSGAGEAAAATVFQGSATCAQPAVTVTASLTIGSSGLEDASVANVGVADGQAVSAHARYVQVDVVSDTAFAAELSGDTVSLGGSLANCVVASVKRTGDTSATVRIDGDPGAAGSDGVVVFGEGSFVDANALGGAAVSVEAPVVSFSAEGSSYDGAGTFLLPVTVENGRFSRTAGAQDWLFSDAGLEATSFAVDANDDRCGMLAVRATQADAAAQMNALSAALDVAAPGLTLAPELLVGEAAATLADDAIDGRAATLANAASAVPYGGVQAVSVERPDDGSLTVRNRVTLAAEDGSVRLTEASQIGLPGQQDSGLLENSQVTIGTVADNGFDFTFYIDADKAKSWYEGYLDSNLTTEEAEAQFLDELTRLMCGHKIDLANGVVLNAYGIPQGPATVYLSDASAFDGSGGLTLAADGSSDAESAKQAFEALEKIVAAIGYFSSGTGGAAGGISELFGLIAGMIDPSPQITLETIYDELQQMKGQLSRMETSIDRMAVELQAVDKRAGFDSEWYEVKWLIDHLSSYGGPYTTLAGKLEPGSANDDLDALMAANKKLLGQYANAIDKKDALLSTTVFADTSSLGTMVLGTGQTDIVGDYNKWIETYYNWDPETFAAKDQYLTSVMMAYTYGYSASMAYLTVKASEEDPDDSFNVYAEAKDNLKKQAGQVVRKLAGELGTDEAGGAVIATKSAYRQATEPIVVDGETRVRNLLSNKTYPTQRYFFQDIYAGARDSFYTSVEKDRLCPYTFNGDLNLAQYQQMAANLPQVRGLGGTYAEVKSLWDELRALGFDLSDAAVLSYHQDIKQHPAWVYWHQKDHPVSMVAVGDATYNKLKDRTAIEHVRSMTLDVFDLQTNQVVRGVMVSHHEEHWSCGASEWQYKHDIYPVRNIVDHILH